MKLNYQTKALLTAASLILAIIGFLIKLPFIFRYHDKEMHFLFYFLAAAFLNIFFAKRIIFRHVVILIFLILFGIAIEFAQEYSNKFLHKRIHGRFDIEDIQSNFKGLIVFSILWITYNIMVFVRKRRNTSSSRC